MDEIVSLIFNPPILSAKKDDDIFDRVNSRYSVGVLLAFAGVVSVQMYIGESPINCWTPAHFTESNSDYANSYCWVRNTYYLPYGDYIPKDARYQRDEVKYYQWVPIILLVQALGFYLPSMVWHTLNNKAGVDADSILQTAQLFSKAESVESRKKIQRILTLQLDRFLRSRVNYASADTNLLRKGCGMVCRLVGRRFGAYIVVLFLFVKLLYAANVIGQMFILNHFLATTFTLYGWEVMQGVITDHDWTESPQVLFPRVTMCDMKIRRLGNVHRYTLQCALPLNLYNEKIFIFIWFWLLFVILFTTYGFFSWIYRIFSHGDRCYYIKRHLSVAVRKNRLDSSRLRCGRFVTEYLRHDGVFLLRLIGHNTDSITVSDVTEALWDIWSARQARINEEEEETKRL